MTELDKLEAYLREHRINYSREDIVTNYYGLKFADPATVERHQLIVFSKDGKRQWDAVCHKGSYGYDEGLLEIMGEPVVREIDGDTVVGYLTAQDVIDRLEGKS